MDHGFSSALVPQLQLLPAVSQRQVARRSEHAWAVARLQPDI